MPITSPQLDDLRYDRLVEELIRRIPVHTPEWTDHNDSDPGITLIQLFAHLTELTGYRLNRVPEKNHIELLKLLGVRLKAALAAQTHVAFMLNDPSSLESYTLPRGSRLAASVGEPPPSFETDRDIDIVPSEPTLLITTANEKIWDLGTLEEDPDPPLDPLDNEFLTVIWDGDNPKLKEMPLEPVVLIPEHEQRYLWVGLAMNDAVRAGFKGTRVTLTIQFDDDEQPDLAGTHECREVRWSGIQAETIDWIHYYDEDLQGMRQVLGRIDDTTDQLKHSGTIRFIVPDTIGPIDDELFKDLRDFSPGESTGCAPVAEALNEAIETMATEDSMVVSDFRSALTNAISDMRTNAIAPKDAILHPLDPTLREKANAWFRLTLPGLQELSGVAPKLRMVTFNAVSATHGTTVTNELLGKTTGRAGQQVSLANKNVLGEVELAIQEDVDGPMTTWTQVDSFDPYGPHDRVFELDAEAGQIYFGDGHRGRIPPLVPRGGNIVALRYRHGGGRAGHVDVGTITSLANAPDGLRASVNFVAARGGRDAETLDEAKERARKELSTRHRAVTASDFQFIAGQTPDVRVARVEVIPLRQPLLPGSPCVLTGPAHCGDSIPSGPAGLNDELKAYGAVSVVVVPDLPDPDHPEPIPTPSFLEAVCRHLDEHRLVTTEVYVVPPQYLRLCNFSIVVHPEPGYTRTQIQALVEERLGTYLHVLKGGQDGTGFPFGGQLHAADLIAQVYRTEGVNRVERLTAEFTRTKSNTIPRQGCLVLCPVSPGEVDSVDLAPEENVSVDLSTLLLSTDGGANHACK